MRLLGRAAALLACILFVSPGALGAATMKQPPAGSESTAAAALVAIHTYDEFILSTTPKPIGTSYPGFVYSTGAEAWCDPDLNSVGYPPTTPPCAAADVYNGWVTIDILVPVLSFEADFMTGPVEVNPYGIVIEGYDLFGNLVAYQTGCVSGYGASTHCGIQHLGGLARVVIHDTGNYWAMDTAIFGGPGGNVQCLNNDNRACARPILTLPSTNVQSTSGYTTEAGEQSPCGGMAATAWYVYAPAFDGWVTFDTIGSDYDTVLAAYEGGFHTVACNDDAFGSQSAISFYAYAGVPYHIQAGGFHGGQGSLVLNGS